MDSNIGPYSRIRSAKSWSSNLVIVISGVPLVIVLAVALRSLPRARISRIRTVPGAPPKPQARAATLPESVVPEGDDPWPKVSAVRSASGIGTAQGEERGHHSPPRRYARSNPTAALPSAGGPPGPGECSDSYSHAY